MSEKILNSEKKVNKIKSKKNISQEEENKEIKLTGKKRLAPDENLSVEKKEKENKTSQKIDEELKEMEKRNELFIEEAKKHPLNFFPPENPEIYPETNALLFKVIAKFNKARAGILSLPHGEVLTPVYMPVGTKGALKGLLSSDLERMGCKLMLSNTYHLALEPGGDFLSEHYGGKAQRGIHNYMNWSNNVLTDSGGFQVASLVKLSERSEKGVDFISHISGDNRHLMLSPEESMRTQNNIGSDIIMALDDVVSPKDEHQIYDACERSLRWIDRCIKAHKRKNEQNLYGIIQGGINLQLRKKATIEWAKRNLPGYAIGGMSGGETKEQFCDVVLTCTENLPENKPRYLMGIGYPVDLVVCTLLGVDQFDCVFPTRTARFGSALTNYGILKLTGEKNEFDFRPIDSDCDCEICKKYSRSYLHFMLNKNSRAIEMISFHNVYYLFNLMKKLRGSILDNKVNEFIKDFITKQFKDSENGCPDWVINALKKSGCDMSFCESQEKEENQEEKSYPEKG